MHNLINYLEEMEDEYSTEIKSVMAEISTLPEGYLRTRQYKGYTCYLQVEGKKETGISKDWSLICKLARKRYLSYYLKRLYRNLNVIRKARPSVINLMPEEIIATLPVAYQDLPVSAFFPDYNENWSCLSYKNNPFRLEDRKIVTSKGVFVRSKSEQLIGNALEKNSIMYHYEEMFEYEHHRFYPDFIIQKPTTGELIIWEHFGCTDNVDYQKRMNEKISIYQKSGLIPWKNLVFTYEEDTKDTRRINEIIKHIILLAER